MFERVFCAEKALAGEVADLEPGVLGGDDAARLLGVFTRIEHLAVAAKTKLARRVEQSNVWRRDGHKTAASFLSQQSGESLTSARQLLDTAEALEQLPATADAFERGELSLTQAKEIAAAASANPDSERRLLQQAGREPFKTLKDACRGAKNSAQRQEDDQARYRRIHRSRYWREWTEGSGAVCGQYRLTPDVGAALHAQIRAEANQIFDQARREGRRDKPEAYGADALVRLAHRRPHPDADADGDTGSSGASGGPRAMVHVRVDHAVLLRGFVADGETCEIAGIGPVPAATAAWLAHDCWLKVLVTDGVDIRAVAHAGRTIPTRLGTALEERDRRCVVPGCTTNRGLEIHHYPDYTDGTPASLATCCRLCHWHHYLITYCGYRIDGTSGHWTWTTHTGPGPGPGSDAGGPDPP